MPAMIADNTIAAIPVRAPFLNVIMSAYMITITNQKPKANKKNPTIPNTTIFWVKFKKEITELIINGGVEYPIALITWFKDSASPLIALPI